MRLKKSGPDDTHEPAAALRPNGETLGDAPEVLKVVLTRGEKQLSRRALFRGLLAGGAVALAGAGATGCDTGTYEVQVDSRGNCRCHVVCTCDAEASEGKEFDSQWNGDVCTCNTVCVCNTVCNCQSVSGSNSSSGSGSGGGGSSSYWYPN
jgi:hypothetical protein